MVDKTGIIDITHNPFATWKLWINQRYRFTTFRQDDFRQIVDKSSEEIREIGRNKGRYVAFVAIR